MRTPTKNPEYDPNDPANIFLTEKQLAQRHQCSPKTLQNDRWKGTGIPFVKWGQRGNVRYRLSDVLAWEEAHLCRSTSDKPREPTKRNDTLQDKPDTPSDR